MSGCLPDRHAKALVDRVRALVTRKQRLLNPQVPLRDRNAGTARQRADQLAEIERELDEIRALVGR